MPCLDELVEQTQGETHVAGDLAAGRARAIVGAKRPWRTRGVSVAHIGGEHARVLERLIEVAAILGFLVKQNEREAGDAALVGFDLVGLVGLRAAIGREGKLRAPSGGAREARILAGIGRQRFLHQVVAHVAGEFEHFRIGFRGVGVILQYEMMPMPFCVHGMNDGER